MHYLLVDPPVHIYNSYVFAVSKHGFIFTFGKFSVIGQQEVLSVQKQSGFFCNDCTKSSAETGSAHLFARVLVG